MTTTLDLVCRSICTVRPDLDPAWVTADSGMRNDLGMSSIDLINTLALITQATGRKVMYEPLLLPGGVPRAELTPGELAGFIDAAAATPAPAVVGM